MSSAPFRTLSARTLFRNRWIALEEHEVEAAADGHQFTYTYLSVKPSVMIVAVTREGRIPIIRQYRYPSKAYNYELPGGGSAGRPPEETALAELKEETGYTAGNVEKIGDFITYCGLADEVCHVVLATELQPGRQNTEPTESIEVREVEYAELLEMIRAREFRDGMGLAALHVARERLEQLLGV
ncbi:MAG: NUDIX hydrolase [Acidobacteria bacterium]|nr:NUDIX hydrolase [Acidobacteriota bacterium]